MPGIVGSGRPRPRRPSGSRPSHLGSGVTGNTCGFGPQIRGSNPCSPTRVTRRRLEVVRVLVVGLAVVVARLERALVLVGLLGVDERRGLLPLGGVLDEHRLRLLEALLIAAARLLDGAERLA